MASVLASLITAKSSDLKRIPHPLTVQADSEVTIGRGEKCHLRFDGVKSISHVHCHVRTSKDKVEVKCVSSNKTFLDGSAMTKDEWRSVHDGAVLALSQDPKVRVEIRIGTDPVATLKRKQHSSSSKKRGLAIAEISSLSGSESFFVVPQESDPNEVVVRVGRGKECEVSIDNKKISSLHSKLTFSKDSNGDWKLHVETSSKNKTYLASELIEDSITFPFTEEVKVAFVFPLTAKPVEVLTITPLTPEAPSEPLTAAEMIEQELQKEEKRQKREIRQLDKQGKEWGEKYKLEIQALQDTEHKMLAEIEALEGKVRVKTVEIEALAKTVGSVENKLKEKETEFNANAQAVQAQHEERFNEATKLLEEAVSRHQRLVDEKTSLQMMTQ